MEIEHRLRISQLLADVSEQEEEKISRILRLLLKASDIAEAFKESNEFMDFLKSKEIQKKIKETKSILPEELRQIMAEFEVEE